MANYQALTTKYNFISYSKLNTFIDQLPGSHQEQFHAIVNKGQLVAKTALQSVLAATETAAQSISTAVVMWRASRLHLSSFPLRATDFLLRRLTCPSILSKIPGLLLGH